MIRSEAEDQIRFTLGRTGTALRTEIIFAMNLAKRQLEGMPELPWFLISEVAEATCTVGEERLEVPANFLREVEEEGTLFVYDTSDLDTDSPDEWIELIKWDNETLRANHSDQVSARDRPTHYALVGNYFKLYPVPDEAYTLKMLYYKEDTDFSSGSDTENQWLKWAPDVIITKAGKWIATRLRDEKARAMFEADYPEAYMRMRTEDEARRQANFTQWMGQND